MKKLLVKLLLLAVVAGAVVGCRSAMVYNVDEQSIVSSGKPNMKDIKSAILRAGASLGWQMKESKPGQIVATLFLRKHMAQVDITYSTKSYSITYKNSSNLNYDGETIHSNYNGWVQNLQRQIDAQLTGV